MRYSRVYPKATIVAYLVLQYLVRAYQIYQSCMKFKRVRRWIRGAFNFLLYILAAHVLGAFWYFCSIQRETSCWQQACKNNPKCGHAYYCSDTGASTNISFLNESCPINPSNTTIFDFGIFIDALQSGNTGSVGFLTKYFYTFWWGIRNLSNFGTNLEPSSYLWESCFAVIICIIGLLLFMYLIGNVQTYIQMETQNSLLVEEEKIKTKYQDIDTWMSDSLPEDMKMEITESIKRHNVVEKHLDVDVDIKFVLSFTPTVLVKSFKEHLCMNALKKVPMLQNMSEVGLRMMCAYVRPQVYDKNSYVFRKGERIDSMVVIVKGTLICSKAEELRTSSSTITEPHILRKGDCYGEKLLLNRKRKDEGDDCYGQEHQDWENTDDEGDEQEHLDSDKCTSTQDVQCHTKVEALVLTLKPGSDIQHIVDYWRKRKWDQNFTPLVKLTGTEIAIERILNQMVSQSGTTEKTGDGELRQKRNVMFKEKGILDWVSRNGLPDNLKTEIMTNMKVGNDVGINMEADVDVEWLLSTNLPEHVDISIKKHLCMDTLKRIPILENMDEEVLMSICKHLEPVVYNENSYLCRAGDRLECMLIIIEGIFVWTNRHGEAVTSSSPLTTRGIVKGDFCGEDILSWESSNNSFSTPAPIWSKDIKCQKKVEAFALTAENLRQVVSENKIKWDRSLNNCAGASTSGTTDHRALEQIIQAQGDMLREQLVLVRESMAVQARRLDDMTAFLAKSGYPGILPPVP